jgi:hypothetical protein
MAGKPQNEDPIGKIINGGLSISMFETRGYLRTKKSLAKINHFHYMDVVSQWSARALLSQSQFEVVLAGH